MSRTSFFILTCALIGVQLAQSAPDFLVQTTRELFVALEDAATARIFLSNTLTISAKDWPRTVNITRPVLISATPERLTAQIYVLLDFKNLAMMFQLDPGIMLTFRGLELVNHYDTVGPTFRPLRQSIGATVLFENCVQRRRAGLPYYAAIINMAEATRPIGVSGTQVCLLMSNLAYMSTRSTVPITFLGGINMSDYSTTVTPDSSLAYQNLYYGGYTYTTVNSYYAVDNVVSDKCMAERPGTECVTLLLQQLDGVGNPDNNKRKSHTVIVAVVIPVSMVLLGTVAVMSALYHRRRRRAGTQLPESKQPANFTDMEAAGEGAKGCMQSPLAARHEEGCIFMGLEKNQQLPEWSPLAAEVVEECDEDDGTHGQKRMFTSTWAATSKLADTDAILSPLTGSTHQQEMQCTSVSDGTSCARGWDLLRHAMSTHVLTGDSGACQAGDVRAAAGEAAADATDGGGGGPAGNPGNGTPPGGSNPTNSGPGGSGAAPPTPDMQAELGRLAQELRASVKDEAIKLEAIIGSGSFGTVYRGTWQGLPVAVKTLVFSASDENRRRALQEAALCASISHPNVVATYCSELQPLGTLGVGPNLPTSAAEANLAGSRSERDLSQILEWRLYIVQEFADGGPLRRLYSNRSLWPSPGVVNMPAVVSLALGIARALTHLHSKRIVHGDLNPNNVLLKRDDNEPSGYTVKVGDFGLSVMLPQNRSHLSNLRMGTMFYMCPAVVMKGQVGPPSDVFSLGVMLWELYHGRRAGIRTDQGPRYSSIFPAFPPTCPEAYRAVALHCLQRQPQNRPAAALVELHLERLLAVLTTPVQSSHVQMSGSSVAAPVSVGSTSSHTRDV